MTFYAGQVLITDKDFEMAIKTKEDVVAYQGNQRLRPISQVIQFNNDSARLADGTTIFRETSEIRTLNDEERTPLL